MVTTRSRERPSALRPSRGSDPRAVALGVIRRVTEEGAYSNLSLAAALARSSMPKKDRQLTSELAYGTLRRLIPLDLAISAAATRDLASIEPAAIALLRLGAYQILYLRTPAHAAVAETVSLAEPRFRGFVNAVLRRVSERAAPASSRVEDPTGSVTNEFDDQAVSAARESGDATVSASTGLSPWAVAELRKLLPAEEVLPAARGLSTAADLTIRVNRCRASTDAVAGALRSSGYSVTAGGHHPDALHLPGGNPGSLPGYVDGWFVVQDEASMLVAEALGATKGERVLDACAAPGGKTSHLACKVAPGGLTVAADLRLPRAGLIRSTAGRLGASIQVLVQDARHPALKGAFDAVLVDAPCSGIGAARRRPELLWRPKAAQLATLARLQVAIVVASAGYVRPGGRLVYSVCTFPRAETDAAVRAFLSKMPEFEPAEVPGPDGTATSHRLWPHRHGTDAMFYAGFRRRGRG